MAKKNKSVKEIRNEFHSNIQKLADKGGYTISAGMAGEEMKVIAKPSDDASEEPGSNYRRVIKSAKLIGELTLDVQYHEQHILISNGGTKRIDVSGSISRTGDNIIHDDLKDAFKKLNVHLACIAEMVKLHKNETCDETQDKEQYEPFKVSGFTISMKDGEEGIVLIGQKELSTGNFLKITTPPVKWSDNYTFISELSEAIESCKHEVIEYLNGKMAPPAQAEMEFEAQEESLS